MFPYVDRKDKAFGGSVGEVKLVINYPKNGKSYKKVIDENKIDSLVGLRIGEEFDGGLIDMPGYKLKITGGTDKDGFPMRKGIHTAARIKVLVAGGTGYKPKNKGVRRRKTLRGEIVDRDIAQLNLVVVKEGKQSLDEMFKQEDSKE